MCVNCNEEEIDRVTWYIGKEECYDFYQSYFCWGCGENFLTMEQKNVFRRIKKRHPNLSSDEMQEYIINDRYRIEPKL